MLLFQEIVVPLLEISHEAAAINGYIVAYSGNVSGCFSFIERFSLASHRYGDGCGVCVCVRTREAHLCLASIGISYKNKFLLHMYTMTVACILPVNSLLYAHVAWTVIMNYIFGHMYPLQMRAHPGLTSIHWAPVTCYTMTSPTMSLHSVFRM